MTILEQIVKAEIPRMRGLEKELDSKTKEEFVAFCHSSSSGFIAMQMRNKYHIWNQKGKVYRALVEEFKLEKVDHPDDISAKIVEAIYDEHHGNKVDK